MVENTTIASILHFVDNIMEETKDGIKAAQIVTADRDVILAEIYRQNYGNTIASTLGCQSCGERFDLHFSLSDLQKHLLTKNNQHSFKRLEDGSYRYSPKLRFRLPNGEDELAVSHLSGEKAIVQLLKRCILEGKSSDQTETEAIQESMQQIAPILQTDMKAICPECNYEQTVRFDIQSYLLSQLLNEKAQISREIHLLASRYHWSYQEILGLSRKMRRMYVENIQAEG